jgi:predicted DNA-binding WGR domain protein
METADVAPLVTRRFTCTEGTSNKFWDVTVGGSRVVARWGRIGSEGQSQDKVFAGPSEAKRFVEKTVAQKLAKGYKETT